MYGYVMYVLVVLCDRFWNFSDIVTRYGRYDYGDKI